MLSPVIAPLSLKKKVLIGSLIGLVVVGTIVGVIVGFQGSSAAQSKGTNNSNGDRHSGSSPSDDVVVDYGSGSADYCFVLNGNLYIPIPSDIGCAIRTDTFERVYPSSEGYVQVPSSFDASVELYRSSRSGDCIDFVSELSC
jgi:hypothetical protein